MYALLSALSAIAKPIPTTSATWRLRIPAPACPRPGIAEFAANPGSRPACTDPGPRRASSAGPDIAPEWRSITLNNKLTSLFNQN